MLVTMLHDKNGSLGLSISSICDGWSLPLKVMQLYVDTLSLYPASKHGYQFLYMRTEITNVSRGSLDLAHPRHQQRTKCVKAKPSKVPFSELFCMDD